MKKFILLVFTAMGLLVASSTSYAQVHGGHAGGGHGGHGGFYGHRGFYGPRFGISIGDPFFYGPWPYYYGPPPVYYAPQPFYVDPGPETYIERDDGSALGPDYRYYCANPAGYYPQIPRCPKGWLKVVPDDSPPR